MDWNKTTEKDLGRGIRGVVNHLQEHLPPSVIPQLPAAKDCHCERSEAISVGRAFRRSSFPRRRESRLDPGSESGVTTDRHGGRSYRPVVGPASLPAAFQTRYPAFSVNNHRKHVSPRSLRTLR
jgi:hypothetical protein